MKCMYELLYVYLKMATSEYRFPPAISVQRLAPQVQRQLRETQELIKDSCSTVFSGGYTTNPNATPPPSSLRAQTGALSNRTLPPTGRRHTLDNQFSPELS